MNRTSRYLTLGAAVAALAATMTEVQLRDEARTQPAICSHDGEPADETKPESIEPSTQT